MGPAELIARLVEQGIRDERVLTAIAEIPRTRFVPPELHHLAWQDEALPIGHEQTISQPYVVAVMTEALQLKGHERVLDIGTGSGYQAAVLSRLCAEVYTVEIVAPLLERARRVFQDLRLENIHSRQGDGYHGWPEKAPFDAILCAAAAERVPEPLVGQLRHGARMVAPVGPPHAQQLLLLRRVIDGQTEVEAILPVRFVPMTGEAERQT